MWSCVITEKEIQFSLLNFPTEMRMKNVQTCYAYMCIGVIPSGLLVPLCPFDMTIVHLNFGPDPGHTHIQAQDEDFFLH